MSERTILRKYKFAVFFGEKENARPILGGYIISKFEKNHVDDVLTAICLGLSHLHKDHLKTEFITDKYGYLLEEPEEQDVTGTPQEAAVKAMTS